MPYSVDIVVLSNIKKSVPAGVELSVGLPTKDPWSLPFGHKRLFADRCEAYELFIYSEDDMLVTEKNIKAFLAASAFLPEDEIAGFFRFEEGPHGQRNYPEMHGHFHWDPQSVRSRDGRTFAFFTCEHSACYLLTRSQLRHAIQSGGFLVGPHQGKYDLACSAATDPYTRCGVKKLVNVSQIEDFLVHHLPNKYVGTRFGVDESEFRKQINTLLKIGKNGHRPASLFDTETKLADGAYSKDYYEPLRPELATIIPQQARMVLSVGCGWGATEEWLADRGLRVTAVALDPVIPSDAVQKKAEVLVADLAVVAEKLANQRFDCILLLNVLHLVPDPAALLRSFSNLLSSNSSLVVLVPNMSQFPVLWGRICGDERLRHIGTYETSGVHVSSRQTVRKWFRHAGMKIEKTVDILPPRSQTLSRLTCVMMNPFLASEFFAVAKRS